jgi:hypothetical protein
LRDSVTFGSGALELSTLEVYTYSAFVYIDFWMIFSIGNVSKGLNIDVSSN